MAVGRWRAAPLVLVGALCLSVLVLVGRSAPAQAADWLDERLGYRFALSVGAAGVAREARMVDTRVDFGALLGAAGAPGFGFDPTTIRVVEVDGSGVAIGTPLPVQFDEVPTQPGVGQLIFPLPGKTAADASRTFHVYFDRPGKGIERQVVEEEVSIPPNVVVDAGQPAFAIQNAVGTWYFQKSGASLSSLVDNAGQDWLSFAPAPNSGAEGEFRGMPNFPYPEGIFHPGFNLATTKVLTAGPLKVVLEATSLDNQWQWRAAFYPNAMVGTVTRAARSYWLLYEGTPGGRADPDDIVFRPGAANPAAPLWGTYYGDDIAAEEWTAFGDRASQRSLFFAHHEDDAHTDFSTVMGMDPTSGGGMTVFGFGRGQAGEALLTGSQTFTVGLVDSIDANVVAGATRSAYRNLSVTMGPVEKGSGGGVVTTTTTTSLPNVDSLGFQTVGPTRVADTRSDGGVRRPLAGGETRAFAVAGVNGVPVDAKAVAVTLSVTETAGPGYLRAWGSGRPEPGVSNLNWQGANATKSNLAILPLGSDGKVAIKLAGGSAHVFLDVVGVFSEAAGGAFHPVNPVRLVDTRDPGLVKVGAGAQMTVSTASVPGIPKNAMKAAVINLTAVAGSAPVTYLTAYPGPGAPPGTSNMNPLGGQILPTAAIVPVQADGTFLVYNRAGSVDVIVDFVGWFDGSGEGGQRFHPIEPTRIHDSRIDLEGLPLGAGQERVTPVAGSAGVPLGAAAAVVNVTVDQAQSFGYLAVYPVDASRGTSTQNLEYGLTRANLVLTRLSGGGSIAAFNSFGTTHLIYDVAGWFG